jgi:Na+-transporting NADH:ubiquinone oxidoreductase subunit NqrA
MPTTSKALFRGAATTNVATVLYTTPSATTTIVTNIAVCNTSASEMTFTLGLASTGLHQATPIAGNTTVYIDCKQVIAAGQAITGGAAATAVQFHISGVEVA